MGFYAFIILIVAVAIVTVLAIIYKYCQCDAGYNIGRNYMHDLGFSDDDIAQGKDDDDADMYVFRKRNKKK